MNDFAMIRLTDLAALETRLDRIERLLAAPVTAAPQGWQPPAAYQDHFKCSAATMNRRIRAGALTARGFGKTRVVWMGPGRATST